MKVVLYRAWLFQLGISCCLCFSSLFAQVPLPADKPAKPILLFNATAHIGNGQVIEKAALTIENGIITQLGTAESVRVDVVKYEVMDLTGKHLYPGLVLPAARLGLEEVSALRQTRDHSEVGDYNPNVRALTSYNTDSELIATLRNTGVLVVQTTPRSGIFSGTSSVVLLDGWNWEDVVYEADEGIHLNWPALGKDDKKYAKRVDEIVAFLTKAKSYAKAPRKKDVPINLKFEALLPLFKGDKRLYLHAYRYDQMIDAFRVLEEMDLLYRVVLVGGHDALYVADYLHSHQIPVILATTHRLPSRPEEDLNLPYRLPQELHRRGIKVALTFGRYDMLASYRNLPFLAGTAAAFGMDKEVALQLITLNAAEILGIGQRAGSLEVGKDAHVLVSEGDLLDMKSNNILHAFVKGRPIELKGKQEKLYERFKDKYEREGAFRPVPPPSSTPLKARTKKKRKPSRRRP